MTFLPPKHRPSLATFHEHTVRNIGRLEHCWTHRRYLWHKSPSSRTQKCEARARARVHQKFHTAFFLFVHGVSLHKMKLTVFVGAVSNSNGRALGEFVGNKVSPSAIARGGVRTAIGMARDWPTNGDMPASGQMDPPRDRHRRERRIAHRDLGEEYLAARAPQPVSSLARPPMAAGGVHVKNSCRRVQRYLAHKKTHLARTLQ